MKKLFGFLLVFSFVTDVALAKRAPRRDDAPRKEQAAVEKAAPKDNGLPYGVVRRYFLWERPHRVACGPKGEISVVVAPPPKKGEEIPLRVFTPFELWHLSPSAERDAKRFELTKKYGEMRSLEFTRDQSHALVGGKDGTRLLDLKTGKDIAMTDIKADAENALESAVVSADGKYAAALQIFIGDDGKPTKPPTVRLLGPGGKVVGVPAADATSVVGVSSGGEYLLTTHLKDTNIVASLRKKDGTQVVIAPRGELLLASRLVESRDGKRAYFVSQAPAGQPPQHLHLFDYGTGKVAHTLKLPAGEWDVVASSGDFVLLSMKTPRGTALVAFDTHTGAEVKLSRELAESVALPCDPTGEFVALVPGRNEGPEAGTLDIARLEDLIAGEAPTFAAADTAKLAKAAVGYDALPALRAVRALAKGNVTRADVTKAAEKAFASLSKEDRELLGALEGHLAAQGSRADTKRRVKAMIAEPLSYADQKLILDALEVSRASAAPGVSAAVNDIDTAEASPQREAAPALVKARLVRLKP